jgi:hypothetical protein
MNFSSIGGTARGMQSRLNETIRDIIRKEGDLIDAYSTDGSRKPRKEYPAVDIRGLSVAALARIIHRTEGAVMLVRGGE